MDKCNLYTTNTIFKVIAINIDFMTTVYADNNLYGSSIGTKNLALPTTLEDKRKVSFS